MRSLQEHLAEFEARGVRLIGISADPPETNREHRTSMRFTFPILADPGTEVIRRYDLLHQKAGEGEADIARPAEFYVDRNGTVRWVNLTPSIAVRARPEQILKGIDEAVAGRQAPTPPTEGPPNPPGPG